jgi:hypothetical protein
MSATLKAAKATAVAALTLAMSIGVGRPPAQAASTRAATINWRVRSIRNPSLRRRAAALAALPHDFP